MLMRETRAIYLPEACLWTTTPPHSLSFDWCHNLHLWPVCSGHFLSFFILSSRPRFLFFSLLFVTTWHRWHIYPFNVSQMSNQPIAWQQFKAFNHVGMDKSCLRTLRIRLLTVTRPGGQSTTKQYLHQLVSVWQENGCFAALCCCDLKSCSTLKVLR